MADGKPSFVLYSDRLRNTILGADRLLGKMTMTGGGTPKDNVFIPEDIVVPTSYTGPFDTIVSLEDSESQAEGMQDVEIRVLNSSNSASSNAGIVYLGYRTLNIATATRQVTIVSGTPCDVFCFVWLAARDVFNGGIYTSYDNGYDPDNYKTDDTHARIEISSISLSESGAVTIERKRMLDSIDITGRWF